MKDHKLFPSGQVKSESIAYKLFEKFNDQGNPVLKEGIIYEINTLEQLYKIISTAIEYEIKIAPVAIGELVINISGEDAITLQLVFDMKQNKYMNMFYYNESLFQVNEKFGDFIERFRNDSHEPNKQSF